MPDDDGVAPRSPLLQATHSDTRPQPTVPRPQHIDHGNRRGVQQLVADTPPVDLMLYMLSYLKRAKSSGDVDLMRTTLMKDIDQVVAAYNAEGEVVTAGMAQAWHDWLTAMARVRGSPSQRASRTQHTRTTARAQSAVEL